jgi:hypothetical protein
MNPVNPASHSKSLIDVGAFYLQMAGGVLGLALTSIFVREKGDRRRHRHVEWVDGVFGFLFSFAIIHILRTLVAGLADTLLICFTGDREALRRDDPDIAAKPEEQQRHDASPAAPLICKF